jgi:hypothetical protein
MAGLATMLLDDTWDLTVDAAGNMALAPMSPPDNLAQDAASAVRTWLGEEYWNTQIGIPWQTILGSVPNLPLLKQQLVNAALTVPGVATAIVFLSSFDNRAISGQIQVVAQGTGQTSYQNFFVIIPQGE